MKPRSIAAVIAAVLLMVPRADAQLLFDLNPADRSGFPGAALTFNATLTNSGADAVFLNGDASSLFSSALTLDDTLFFANAPLSLASGESWTGDIFTVSIDSSASPGPHLGSFSAVGGADGAAQDTLATQYFEVDAVPEPACLQLGALLALGGLAVWRVRRRA